MDKYYNHPLREEDVDSIERTYTRVKENEEFVPAEEVYSKETEFLLTEGEYGINIHDAIYYLFRVDKCSISSTSLVWVRRN